MATYTIPFEIGERVVIGSNTVGAPQVAGTVVEIWNTGASTFTARVRVPDDIRGNFDFHVPTANLTAEDAED